MAACFAADQFFSAKISNPHTRRAYARSKKSPPCSAALSIVPRPTGLPDSRSRHRAPLVRMPQRGAKRRQIELCQVTPGLAGRFIEELPGSDPTRNLALAALRHFFDALVTRHAVALNPFASVRGRTHAVASGSSVLGPAKRNVIPDGSISAGFQGCDRADKHTIHDCSINS